MTDQELEDRLAWNTCATTVNVYRSFVNRMATEAGQAFVHGKTELAEHFRALHREMMELLKRNEAELDGHISRARGIGTSRGKGPSVF